MAKFRPREEWAGKIEMPGGPTWTPDEHAAILTALRRNGTVSVGKPTRPRSEGGREALLKNICTCGATVIGGEDIGKECRRAMAPWHGSRIKKDGTRSMWMGCTHRHRTLNHRLCDAESNKADLLETAVWEAMRKAICEGLDALITAKYAEVTAEEDEALLASLRDEFKRKTAMRKQAMRLQIEARDAADKAEYAGLVAQYKMDLALLERRIQTASSEFEAEQIDSPPFNGRRGKPFRPRIL